jgi:peptide/nickel transport system substrate-binding protein
VEENRITFRFATAAPDALTVFSQWPVLPKHCLEKADPENLQKDSFWKAPIGSGPYRVAETVMGEYAVLEHWEDYRIAGEGNIRRIYLAASGETDEDLVLRADMDMLDLGWGISTDDAWAMDRMEGMKVTVLKIPCIRCFFINQFPHESYLAQTEND